MFFRQTFVTGPVMPAARASVNPFSAAIQLECVSAGSVYVRIDAMHRISRWSPL
jgi:hypothetical protein